MPEPGEPRPVAVGDVELAYVEQGAGTPVVFVHGSVNDLRSWRTQLSAVAESFRAVAYSRRWHWPNTPPDEGTIYAVAQHADDLGALIDALGLAPAHLVGSSYGAMTALTLAAMRPALVRSLTLGEPPLLPWLARTPDGPALLETFLKTAFRPAAAAFARDDDETGVRTFIDGVIGPGTFDRISPEARAMMLANAPAMRAETAAPPERYFASLIPEEVARLPMPVLLLEGERSPRMFGLVTDELARALPAAERVCIPAASHGMHGQNPSAFNATLLAFLTAH